MKQSLLLLIICSAVLLGCAPDIVEPELQGSIQGTVIHAETGERIHSVNIETTPATEAVVTSGNGEFRFVNISTGSYQVRASKQGFQTKSAMVMVKESRTSTATIQLLPREDAAKSKFIKAGVTAWEQIGRPDSSFVNVEYRVNNISESKSIGEFEVYFNIYTDRETYLFEVNNTELDAGEQNIGSFEKYVRDRSVDSVTISGVWIKE
ncbi:MAG: carboxypeptidase-like regulatory domain-containing protein [Balneolaceae bacterium]|nr:carboxypeptidase-like regulatory domain-containing protein [Balneolaceae bacterium]